MTLPEPVVAEEIVIPTSAVESPLTSTVEETPLLSLVQEDKEIVATVPSVTPEILTPHPIFDEILSPKPVSSASPLFGNIL